MGDKVLGAFKELTQCHPAGLRNRPSRQHSAQTALYSNTQPTRIGSYPSSSPNAGLLSPIREHSKSANRDSNVSLPHEAKRYISNLGERPLPSPGLINLEHLQVETRTEANFQQIRACPPGHMYSGDENEFLDMGEEDLIEETEQ
jgi:hypothetical protein